MMKKHSSWPLSLFWISTLRLSSFDLLQPAHVGTQGSWDYDRAVGLLIIFQNCDPSATDGETGAVERVDVFGFAALCASKANLCAARLKRLVV